MTSDIHLELLQSVRIASPCPVRWDQMRGDDKTRHCNQCNLRVHNLSAMSAAEVGELLDRKRSSPGQRVCAGYWRRADGTIIAQNCPVGLRAARARVVRAATRFAAALGVTVAAGAASASLDRQGRWAEWGWSIRIKELPPVRWVKSQLRPATQRCWIAGDIALPSPVTPAPPQRDQNPSTYGPHLY